MNRISHDPSGLVRRKTSTNWSFLQKLSFRTYLSRHPTLMIASSNNISVAARTSPARSDSAARTADSLFDANAVV
jgi:hypothetical protein